MIYCENSKNWKMFWKKWSSQWQPSNRHFDVSSKKKYSKNTKKIQKKEKKKKCLGENLETGALVAKIQKIYKKSWKNKK